jgi:hypothetical protein
MPGLMKAEFDERYRFRESRNGLVSCVTCDSKAGGDTDKEGPAFCENEERFKKIKIAKYWPGWFGPGESENIASRRVCDAYSSNHLPEGVEIPVLSGEQAILLRSEPTGIYHADPNCPYVIAELKIKKEGSNTWAKVNIIDMSEMVPGSTVRDICDMPCCESRLPYQISLVSSYRRRTGLKPDGTEPTIWVKNGRVRHGKESNMSIEEAKAFFDLERFDSSEYRDIYAKIVAVSDHLHKHCNALGSGPLSEAANPVWVSVYHHLLDKSSVGSDTHADFWLYDERLFDHAKGLERPIGDLEKVPEGIIPLMDPNEILPHAEIECSKYGGGRYTIYGILRELEDYALLSRGLTHFIEIGAVSFLDHGYMWGEFGKGFSGLASFHEQ